MGEPAPLDEQEKSRGIARKDGPKAITDISKRRDGKRGGSIRVMAVYGRVPDGEEKTFSVLLERGVKSSGNAYVMKLTRGISSQKFG